MEALNKRDILIVFFILLTLLFSQASGDRSENPHSVSGVHPGITFPLTTQAIDEEVNTALFQAEQEIASLLSIPANERNETNSIFRLEEILTRLDSRLLKYQMLAGLYPDQDLQNAAFMAAEKRDTYIRNIASHDELYRCIKETKPESEYGRWLYDQEIRFFKFGGALRSDEEKTQLSSLYQELGSLQNQYLINIQQNRPLTENLNIITKTAILRNSIASLQGYATWTDLKADEQGWMINGTDISFRLDEITPQVKDLVKPVVTDLLQRKKTREPLATEVYDYEIDSLITSFQRNDTSYERDFSFPYHRTITRSIQLFSCLFSVRTELVPDAQVYAPDVLLFRVADDKTDETKGWFFLDLEERPGKTKEWMTALIAGDGSDCETEGNLPAPLFIVSGIVGEDAARDGFHEEEYSLLFHELGHLYTRILISSDESSQVPAVLPVELTEASSHLFEYLAFTPEVLRILMAPDTNLHTQKRDHIFYYSAIHDPYSAEHRFKLGRDLVIGLLDFRYSKSPETLSFGEAYADIFTDITGVKVTDQGGYLVRSPHLAGDTAGTYWIYPVGQLYAMALYSKVKESGILNKTTWDDFIRHVLIPPDAEKRADQRIKNFLHADTLDIYDRINQNTFPAQEKNWSFVPGCISGIIPG